MYVLMVLVEEEAKMVVPSADHCALLKKPARPSLHTTFGCLDTAWRTAYGFPAGGG